MSYALPAATTGQLRCSFCLEDYSLGEPNGELWIWYPDGERMYRQHCRDSLQHLAWGREAGKAMGAQLSRLDAALAAGRAAQAPALARAKMMAEPTALRLQALLA